MRAGCGSGDGKGGRRVAIEGECVEDGVAVFESNGAGARGEDARGGDDGGEGQGLIGGGFGRGGFEDGGAAGEVDDEGESGGGDGGVAGVAGIGEGALINLAPDDPEISSSRSSIAERATGVWVD